MSSAFTARLHLAAAALLFSTGGVAIKATSLTPVQIASFRSLVAAAFLVLALPAARRGWNRRVLLVSLPYAAVLILFVVANKLTTAANAIFLQSTAPLYVLLLGPWLLREPARRLDFTFGVVFAVGLVLFFLGEPTVFVSAPRPGLGNVVAACSGVAWALTIIGLRWLALGGASGGAPAAVACGNLVVFAATLPWIWPVESVSFAAVCGIAYLGIFQIGLAYALLVGAVAHVRALEAALLLLLEPVLNSAWAWVLFGENPGPLALAGGSVILVGAALKAWSDTLGAAAARGRS